MSQNPILIANDTGANVRAAVNNALDSLATQFSGAGDPATMYPYQFKANTTTGYLQQRNPANDAWYDVRLLDTRVPTAVYAGGVYTVTYTPAVTAYKEGILYVFRANDTNTGTAFFAANALTAKPLVKPTGLVAGDIIAGNIYYLFYSASTEYFYLLNPWRSAPIHYARLIDNKAPGSNGGTFTTGAWQVRDLNTETDPYGMVTFGLIPGSPQFALPAGTYRFLISAPAYAVDGHQALLYNVTDGANALLGSSEYAPAGGGVSRSLISGQVTIAAGKVFEVRHRCATTKADDGLGKAANFGVSEIYTQVEIWQE